MKTTFRNSLVKSGSADVVIRGGGIGIPGTPPCCHAGSEMEKKASGFLGRNLGRLWNFGKKYGIPAAAGTGGYIHGMGSGTAEGMTRGMNIAMEQYNNRPAWQKVMFPLMTSKLGETLGVKGKALDLASKGLLTGGKKYLDNLPVRNGPWGYWDRIKNKGYRHYGRNMARDVVRNMHQTYKYKPKHLS